jgi:hypothetical protein
LHSDTHVERTPFEHGHEFWARHKLVMATELFGGKIGGGIGGLLKTISQTLFL